MDLKGHRGFLWGRHVPSKGRVFLKHGVLDNLTGLVTGGGLRELGCPGGVFSVRGTVKEGVVLPWPVNYAGRSTGRSDVREDSTEGRKFHLLKGDNRSSAGKREAGGRKSPRR